jgi:hypothetical protein
VVVKYDRFASESRHHDKNTRCVAESAHKNPGDWSFLLSYLRIPTAPHAQTETVAKPEEYVQGQLA